MAVNIKLKHSSIDGKAPVAADLENGELALNINENSPAAYIKDSNGDIVKLAGENSVSTDTDAVKKSVTTAQNMTGDLTLGTDKITLGATGGSAEFASTVTVNTTSGSTTAFSAKVGGSEKVQINADGSAMFANTDIKLNADGSAIFDGGATAGDDTNTANGLVARNNASGDTGASIWAINKNANGYVFAGNDENVNVTSSILNDGNATFAKTIEAGGAWANDGSPQVRAFIGSNVGSLRVKGAATADGNSNAFGIYKGGNDASSQVMGVQYDGSGTFASNMTIGDFDLTDANTSGVRVLASGALQLQRDSAANNSARFQIIRGTNDETVTINSDGSATFSGKIESNFASGNMFEADAVWGTNNCAYRSRFGSNGDSGRYHFHGTSADGKNVSIYTDGSAKFTGTITGPVGDATNGTIPFLTQATKDQSGASESQTVIFSRHICRAGSSNAFIYWRVSGGGTSSNSKGQWSLYGSRGNDVALDNSPVIKLSGNGDGSFDGTLTATVVPPSDARFKENITPAKPQLADVVALGGLLKNYDWNDDAPLNEEIRSQRQLGLIAQEVEKVCPSITKDIHRTKQGAVITPEEIIPAVYEEKVIPAEYETVVTPAKLGPRGKEIVPASTEEVLVTPERTEQVLVTPEKVIPATYEELDDSYKGISSEALIMKLIGAVTELSAEVTALKAAKLTKK